MSISVAVWNPNEPLKNNAIYEFKNFLLKDNPNLTISNISYSKIIFKSDNAQNLSEKIENMSISLSNIIKIDSINDITDDNLKIVELKCKFEYYYFYKY